MIKYEELKYVLSGATDWGYEYAKKEDVEAAFAELEERHAMELDQWVLELGKMKRENERLKKDIDTLKTAWEQSQSALSTIAALKFAAEEKLRATRRALWIARAYRAEARKNYWYARSCHEGDKRLWSIDGSPVKYIGCIKRTNFDWLKVWSEVECKCLKKAKEYK